MYLRYWSYLSNCRLQSQKAPDYSCNICQTKPLLNLSPNPAEAHVLVIVRAQTSAGRTLLVSVRWLRWETKLFRASTLYAEVMVLSVPQSSVPYGET